MHGQKIEKIVFFVLVLVNDLPMSCIKKTNLDKKSATEISDVFFFYQCKLLCRMDVTSVADLL